MVLTLPGPCRIPRKLSGTAKVVARHSEAAQVHLGAAHSCQF